MYFKKSHLLYINQLLLSILLILFVSCFNNTKKKGSTIVSEGCTIKLEEFVEDNNSDTSYFISECKNMLSKYTEEWDKKFILQLIETYEKFSNKVLDTVLYTTCFIETNERLDTIQTRIFENGDEIVVHYSWVKNGELLWEKKFTNPYLWVNYDMFFDNKKWTKWEKWITFTIGIYYAPPDIQKIDEFLSLDIGLKELVVRMGLNELQELGFTIDRESYEQYVENFNGNLIVWGDPEGRDGLFIWYEPLQKFVCFYRP